MNIWFLAASIVSFSICLLHIFGGGKIAARPLLNSSMGKVSKYTNYYCWHLVTITLVAIGAMFLWAAEHQGGIELAFMATGLCFAFMVWSFGIVALNKWRFFDFPQWLLFLVPMVLGGVGFK